MSVLRQRVPDRIVCENAATERESLQQCTADGSENSNGEDKMATSPTEAIMIPKIVPLYDGHELNINEQLIMNGLSTISVRNMRSKGFAIEKRNSFFNLHRPELKGLDIVSAQNQQGKMLQQRIIKEVKTIHETKSMKLFHNIDSEQSVQNNRTAAVKDHVKAEGATAETNDDNNLLISSIATTIRNQKEKRFRSLDADQTEESTLISDKSPHGCDEEIKSTLID